MGGIMVKKTKLIARIMLVVILISGMVNLSACQINFPWSSGYIKPTTENFESFSELQKFILPKYVECENTVIAFDLDNEPSVVSTNYIVTGMEKVINKKYIYYVDTITGIFGLKNYQEGSQFMVRCEFLTDQISIGDDPVFEIKLDKIIEYTDAYDLQQKVIVNFYLRYKNKNQVVAEISFEDIPILEEGNYEDYCLNACNILLENLILIK